MGTTLVNTLVSMLCAVSPLKGECCAGLVSAGGWCTVMMLPSHAPEPLLTCTVTRYSKSAGAARGATASPGYITAEVLTYGPCSTPYTAPAPGDNSGNTAPGAELGQLGYQGAGSGSG